MMAVPTTADCSHLEEAADELHFEATAAAEAAEGSGTVDCRVARIDVAGFDGRRVKLAIRHIVEVDGTWLRRMGKFRVHALFSRGLCPSVSTIDSCRDL